MNFLILWIAALVPIESGYRAVEAPEFFRFEVPTTAYALEDPQQKLGDFQAGLEVQVEEALWDEDRWRVRFSRRGAADVVALIPVLNLSQHRAQFLRDEAWRIAEAPLVQGFWEADFPWKVSHAGELAARAWAGGFEVVAEGTEGPVQVRMDPEALEGE